MNSWVLAYKFSELLVLLISSRMFAATIIYTELLIFLSKIEKRVGGGLIHRYLFSKKFRAK